jgi:hypothetical protein
MVKSHPSARKPWSKHYWYVILIILLVVIGLALGLWLGLHPKKNDKCPNVGTGDKGDYYKRCSQELTKEGYSDCLSFLEKCNLDNKCTTLLGTDMAAAHTTEQIGAAVSDAHDCCMAESVEDKMKDGLCFLFN